MAKKKEEVVKADVEFVVPKDAIIDKAVKVISLAGDPYHKDGVEFDMAERTAKKLESRGWVKIK